MLLLDRQRDGRGFWGSDAFNTFDAVLTDWERQACQDRRRGCSATRRQPE
ncbi:hypothetical protein [Burkholderia ubonensis]|nr:hypothetical protein [Burkholderia ubonensis]AJX13504.1 proline--tRNA ligase domain protein [Burkholderia ubonensis MSMB22]